MDSKINRIIYRSSIQLLMTGIILLGISLAVLPLGAQKYDHQWLLGYLPNDSLERFGGTLLNFGQDTINSKFTKLSFSFNANAQICDTSGNLLYMSNGCDLYNEHMDHINHEILGDPNDISKLYCNGKLGAYPLHQCLLILPDKYKPSTHYLFRNQLSNDFKEEATLFWTIMKNEQSINLSNHQYLISDEIGNQITATSHGNGKDWWVVIPRVTSGYYITRIGKDGVHPPVLQSIENGPAIAFADNCCSQACFSPDGNTYISSVYSKGVRIFDFDRCNGTFSNPRFIPLNNDTVAASGVAVSPNNRLLYLSLGNQIFQYDLLSSDIVKSGIRVAKYDGHNAPLPTTFYQMMLTPNDRIIVSSTNGVYEFTQILDPDLRGKDCNVQQHSLILKTNATQQLPNFPNFRAGRLQGSPCDTLFTTNVLTQNVKPLRIFPNPATDRFEVDLTDGYDRLELFDINGRLVQTQYQKAPVAVSGLPEGFYVIRAWKGQRLVGIGKVAVSP